jgi:histidyl-tRNA synthetase
MDAAGIVPEKRNAVMRAIDKMDRLGMAGVTALLGEGRKDDSGDFTAGAKLDKAAIEKILAVLKGNAGGETAEIDEIMSLCKASGYQADRIIADPSIVRGLDYYTGAVFEAELTFPVTNDKGQEVVFGSVAGGGRYDGLVARFRGEAVPATGFSIGVSRLLSALKNRGLVDGKQKRGPVVVCTALGSPMENCQRFAQILRKAGIAAEVYLGASFKLGTQLTYASKRGSACAVIQGDDERAKGQVIVRDMAAGSQEAVAEDRLAKAVQEICGHHES